MPTKDHNAWMNQDRVRQISEEMCHLIDEQSRLLNGATRLGEMSGEELDGYFQRNDRIGQRAKELNGLV